MTGNGTVLLQLQNLSWCYRTFGVRGTAATVIIRCGLTKLFVSSQKTCIILSTLKTKLTPKYKMCKKTCTVVVFWKLEYGITVLHQQMCLFWCWSHHFLTCTQNCKYLKDAAGKTVVGEGLLCISGPLVLEDYSWKSQIVLCTVYSL